MAVVGGGRGGGGEDGGGMCISCSHLCLRLTVQSRMTFNFLSSLLSHAECWDYWQAPPSPILC